MSVFIGAETDPDRLEWMCLQNFSKCRAAWWLLDQHSVGMGNRENTQAMLG